MRLSEGGDLYTSPLIPLANTPLNNSQTYISLNKDITTTETPTPTSSNLLTGPGVPSITTAKPSISTDGGAASGSSEGNQKDKETTAQTAGK